MPVGEYLIAVDLDDGVDVVEQSVTIIVHEAVAIEPEEFIGVFDTPVVEEYDDEAFQGDDGALSGLEVTENT